MARDWPYPISRSEFIGHVNDLLRVYGEEGLRYALQRLTGKLPHRRTIYNWTQHGTGRRTPNRTNYEAIETLWAGLPPGEKKRDQRPRWREIEDYTTRFALTFLEQAHMFAQQIDADIQNEDSFLMNVVHAIDRMRGVGIKWALTGREIDLAAFGFGVAPIRPIRSYVYDRNDTEYGYLLFRMHTFRAGEKYAAHIWLSCQFLVVRVFDKTATFTRQQLLDKAERIAKTYRQEVRLREHVDQMSMDRVLGVWIP